MAQRESVSEKEWLPDPLATSIGTWQNSNAYLLSRILFMLILLLTNLSSDNCHRDNMMKHLTRFTLAVLTAAFLGGCTDERPDTQTKQEASKQPYDPIFNPSPEDIAAREAKEKAALPLTNDLPSVAIADRSMYAEMKDSLMPMRLYLAHKSWTEKSELVADDISGSFGLSPRSSIPKELSDLTLKFVKEQNAFDKADQATAIESIATTEAKSIGDNRLVKVELPATMINIQPYKMDSKTFVLDTNLFTDKSKYEKGFLFNSATSYHYGFIEAAALENVVVEDTTAARALEAARLGASMHVYGYVKRVQREHTHGVPNDKPYVFIKPQFADFVDGNGSTLYTVKL